MAAEQPLRLAHILAPAPFGGLESVVVALAAGMAGRGHAVRVVALEEPGGRVAALDPLAGAGVEIVRIVLPPRNYRQELAKLREELERIPGGVAHCHGYHADIIGLFAARRAGVPVVSTAHGFTGVSRRVRVYEWLDIRALARFDAVIAVSRPLADRLSGGGVPVSRLHLIPNAYAASRPALSREEARAALGIPHGAMVAGWVGRLSPEKGPDVFLEAIGRAPGWRASFIGAGPLLSSLQERAGALGLGDRIRWHGVVPRAGALLQAFDALVLSSRTEGTPIVLLEGMSAGVPIIATAVGGIPDVVTGREAILVSREDPEAVARGLQSIRAESGAAGARVLAARARLEAAYAVEPWLDRHETLYRGLRG